MAGPKVKFAKFGAFEADFATGELRKYGVRLRVPEQSLEILRALVERPGQLVTRESIRTRLWPDGTFVDFEHGLNAAVRRLREALGDTARESRFVETLPRRGYRFIGELEACHVEAEPSGTQAEIVPLTPPVVRPGRGRWVKVAGVSGAVVAVLAAAVIGARLLAPRPAMSLRIVPFTSLPGPEVAPVFSPDGSQLAFAWAEKGADPEGRFDLYSKVAGSEKLLRLTRRPAHWISPAWSPDGRSIAFSRWADDESGIYVVPALGGEERKLASVNYEYPPMMGIAWSPDGRSIVFVGAGASLYTVSAETLQREPFSTGTHCLLAGYPEFSPDGRRLAFTCSSDYGSYGIYLVPKEGGSAERVVQITGNPQGLAWSRDNRIVFSNDPGINEGRLWTLDLATRKVDPLPVSDDARFPAFSPNGAQLAFARGYDNVNIWKVDPRDGAAPQRFVFSTRIQENARISPDGRRVAFDATRSGAHEVWLADSDGSNPVQATHFNAGISGSPAWCADSRRIAFDSRIGGPVSVYVEDVSERIPRRVEANIPEVQLPTWSRDCRSLYVVANAAKTALYRVSPNGGKAELAYSGVAINASETADGALFFADAFEDAQIRRLEHGQSEAQIVPEMPRVRFGTAWQLTDGGIYFVDARSRNAAVISYYDFATRSTRRLAGLRYQVVPWTALSVSPLDGSLIYSQVDDEESDIMLAEFAR